MESQDIDPKMTAICNECTVQEEKRGFFNSLVEVVETNSRIKEWLQDIWSVDMHEKDFIKALIKENDIFSTISKTFLVSEAYRKKCGKTSSSLRDQAEVHLKENELEKAILLCNQAVIRSPYTNDGFDDLLIQSLVLRAKCLLLMKKDSIASRDLNVALECLIQSKNVMSSKSKSLKKEIQSMLNKCNNKVKRSAPTKELLLTKGENNILKGSSKLLTTTKNKEQGRFFIAADNINIGDTLLIENPYASCLKPQYFGTHCHHCFNRLEAPFSCYDCSTVAFCSPECRDIAAQTYHRFECKYMNLFIGSGMSILCHIALRIVTQSGMAEAISVYEQYRSQLNCKGKVNGNTKKSEPYDDLSEIHSKENDKEKQASSDKIIYNLCSHTSQRDPADYLRRMLMSFFLTRCLKDGNFFGNKTPYLEESGEDCLSENEISICCQILINLQMLQFNAHQVNEEVSGKSRDIGVAIYASGSLFNHDCYPAVTRYFIGRSLVVRAMRPLLPGEMVADNYGPRFDRQETTRRQRMLRSRYWFCCTCVACKENWPLQCTKQQGLPFLRCPSPKCIGKIHPSKNENSEIECSICKNPVNKSFIKEKLHIIQECVNNYEENVNEIGKESKLMDFLNTFHSIAYAPYGPIHLAEESLRSCFVS